MARYNTTSQTLIISGNTTFTYAFTGNIIRIDGSAGTTIALVSPVSIPGLQQTFYNNTGGTVTFSTAVGTIKGSGLTSAGTQTMPANTTYQFISDGSDYVLMNDEGGAISATTGTFSSTLTASGTNAQITFSPTGTGSVTINPATVGAINNVNVGASTRGTGAFTTLNANSTVGLSPSNAAVTISPTGTGATVTVNPAVAGTIDNMAIGGTTRAAGKFTTLDANSTVTLSPANANVALSPTGTGVVTISPATLGSIDNVAIGVTTKAAGNFTSIGASSTGTGSFTTLAASSTVSGQGFIDRFASPGPIGNTSAGSGAFTSLSSTGATTFTAGTASTSYQSGTLQVTGGVGVSGNIYTNGNVVYNRVESQSSSSSVTIAASDVGKIIRMTGAGTTLTIPTNASVPGIPIGSVVGVFCDFAAAGNVTFSAASGVTFGQNNATSSAYEEVWLRKRDTDTWTAVAYYISGILAGSSATMTKSTSGSYTVFTLSGVTSGTFALA
jgi:hypothetical protein